ncbi:NAD-binding protein [Fomitiporia mediterranea MF3/22]|uniref:NAD-binding protein n=1 Tax=Fomitiporia mediterranea (strain MF3/22) TaxID=694068 RepID=UPI0004408B32|nr:NAD-binding protein [Fomitiporia mediterranea MF3/22]EJD02777.1 NAD-binding protein [Fomitiporia mediterranea MF3/22]
MSTSIPTSARTVVLQNHPLADQDVDLSSSPSGTFTVKEIPLAHPIPEDSLLVQTLYLSNDTGIRHFIEKSAKYEDDIPTLPLGSPILVFRSIVRVIQVGGGDGVGSFKAGDIVEMWQSQWADYVVVKKDKARPIKQRLGISLSAHLGTIGSPGASAYWALTDVLKTKQTGTIVVSGASGAVGNVAVQFAKHVMGVKNVVGIASSDEKCKWLKSIGADDAVNYKSPTFVGDLRKATLDGVDSFLDNVGGFILDEVMMRMKSHGIICAMGFMAGEFIILLSLESLWLT